VRPLAASDYAPGMTGASGLGELAESQMRDLLFPPTPELIVPQSNLYLPQAGLPAMPEELMGVGGMPEVRAGAASPAVAAGAGYDEHRPKTPPPDLPSLLLDSRIIYLGMPLVPAVTELIVAELLYLQYTNSTKPVFLYINSTGCTRADGTTVGFETEATAIYDTMSYVGTEIQTVGVGVAIGQACMLLSAGAPGKRFMLPHATAMLQQPRVPSTGQRQAVEIYIKWQETLRMKKTYLDILSRTTGHSLEKLDRDMLRPLYMQPKDALEYRIIDKILSKDDPAIDSVKGANVWDKEAGLRTQ
jgi:ATP-dependent Clp endopeptidase proteolytic subunit ClpP